MSVLDGFETRLASVEQRLDALERANTKTDAKTDAETDTKTDTKTEASQNQEPSSAQPSHDEAGSAGRATGAPCQR